MRRYWFTLLVLAPACVGSIGGGDGGEGDKPGPGPLPISEYRPAPPLAELAEPTLDALDASIDEIFAAPPLSATSDSATIVDAETGQVIYLRDPDLLLKPASNTKLLTTAVAMDELGSQHQMETRLYGTGVVTGGVLDGDLHVVGHHDFTWSSRLFSDARIPMVEVGRALRDAGIDEVTGAVLLHGEYLFEGDNFAYYDAAFHRQQVAAEIGSALAGAGVSVGPVQLASGFDPPPEADLLATWRSPPLASAAAPLNKVSHNEFADILARHLGLLLGGESSYGAWNQQMLAWLEAAGIDSAGIQLHDGSGLSHDNRISSRAIADVLAYMLEQPAGAAWERTMAVGNRDGTLGSRLGSVDTAGRFVGKTGTLRDTIALSGVLHNRHDGRRYIVSLLANAVSDSSSTRAAHDRVVQAIAGNHRRTAEVPQPITIDSVRWLGQQLVVDWQPDSSATGGYLIWLSDDGQTWDRELARLVEAPPYVTDDVATDGPVFVRVTSWTGDSDGLPSAVLAAAPGDGDSRALVVDGNQRWAAEPAFENPLGKGQDFASAYAFELAPVGFDSARAATAVRDESILLSDYDAVFWMLGEESVADSTFDADERAAVRAYTSMGGNLFVSGSEVGWDLVAMGDDDRASFYREVLRAEYLADDAETYLVRHTRGGPPVYFYRPGYLDAAYPDVIAPAGGSRLVLEYETGGGAAVVYDAGYRLMYLAFPLESIAARGDRQRILTEAIELFEL